VGRRVSAKIKRSAKAVGIVAALGLVAMFAARPFVALVEDAPAPLDAAPPVYADFESEHSGWSEIGDADSELEDRASRPVERLVAASSGDTLKDLLLRAGVSSTDATDALTSLTEVFNPRNLRAGQKVAVTFAPAPDGFGQGEFTTVSLDADPIRSVAAKRGADRSFEAVESKRQVTRETVHFAGTIRSSLFESAQNVGVPGPMIVTMIHALSYDVDFQRDIQAGDSFDVMFEGYYDKMGKLVRNGDMLYAAVTLSGKPIAMYRFEDGQGSVEYFNDKGESVKKALLKTPVDGARITSGFGMRSHPILGFTKMHKGIDFGVPTGTPIMAAGDGSVEMAGFNGSYGNYVRIRHANNIGTAYAHMSRIAQGVHTGKHISQGQIIGFVGTTGRSTGAHLHYEVLVGQGQVNPMSIKVPTGIKLAGKDLDRFKGAKIQLDTMLTRIPTPPPRVAANPTVRAAD
jgi:murein DD-endopeptidase MepM/ murein hydrolase activator NlpD